MEKLLRVVPPKYSQIALSIEALLDTATLLVEEVTGRLKAVNERRETAAAPEQPLLSGGKLYFTEEQWLARMKEKQGGESSSKPPCSNGGSQQRPRAAKKKQNRTPDAKEGEDDRNRCNNCGR